MITVHIQKKISYICLLFINYLFLFKYLSRVTSTYAWLISLGITVVLYFLVLGKINFSFTNKTYRFLSYILLILFTIASTLVFLKVDINTLNVDRWSVISSFWEAVFSSEYPYYAESHMGNKPGPMPFYFILAFPFYFIGEFGYFSVLGIVCFFSMVNKEFTDKKLNFSLLLFLILSPFYLWEIVTRSNIFITSILVAWFLLLLIKKGNLTNNFYLLAILTGLLLSTRAIFSIPYIIFFMYMLRKKEVSFLKIVRFIIIAFVIFLLTFTPFLLFYPQDFFIMNPFIIQSSFLMPSCMSISFILISFFIAFLPQKKEELFFWSGVMLFTVIIAFIIYNLSKYGVNEFFVGIRTDISYFIFCVPFFILYLLLISENKMQRA